MKYLALVILFLALAAGAQNSGSLPHPKGNFGYLKAEDQPHFKNDSFEGRNQLERIDRNVAEINRLHGEVASLRAQLQELKRELTELKQRK
jgi:predicted RNase H-like nuclease (RuvC/YqgF family)